MTDKNTRKEKLTKERHKQILDAAIEVFTRKGYEAATMPDIAQAAGVAAGTIYLYFPNKRELFIHAVKDIIVTVPLLDLIGKIPTGDFEDVFKNILLERFGMINNQRKTLTLMPSLIGEVQRDPELKEMWLKDFLQPFLSRMEKGYRMLSLTGKARRMEPALAVRMVGGMIFGFMMLRIMEGKASPLEKLPPEQLAEDMVNFVLHGLMKTTGKTP